MQAFFGDPERLRLLVKLTEKLIAKRVNRTTYVAFDALHVVHKFKRVFGEPLFEGEPFLLLLRLFLTFCCTLCLQFSCALYLFLALSRALRPQLRGGSGGGVKRVHRTSSRVSNAKVGKFRPAH
jgi:hypothetical protein